MMRPSNGQQTCGCCKVVTSQEFGKLLEMKDIGVTIYRYLPQLHSENRKGTENGQVFVLHNIGGDDVQIEELIVESGKTKNSCPRCMKAIQHVKSLLKVLPPVNIRDVTGICDHCYQKELFHCPCCEKVVDKFVKITMEETKQTDAQRERNKSWLIKTQLSLKKSFSNVKDSKLKSGAKPGGRIYESHTKFQKPALESEAHKLTGIKGERVLLQEQKKPTKQDIENKLKVQLPPKEFDLDTRELEQRIKSKNRIQEFQTPTPRYGSIEEPVGEPVLFLRMYEKQSLNGEKELLHTHRKSEEEIMKRNLRVLSFNDFPEDDINTKLKPKQKKTGILKSCDDVTGRVSKPYEKTKLEFTPRKQQSFDSFMKSLSEPNLSDFRYIFPGERNITQKEIIRQISSSELLKNTQEMLQEREMKKKEEIVRLKEEKQRMAEEEKRKREEEKRKQEEETAITREKLELEMEDIERYNERNRKKRHGIAATTALREQLSIDVITWKEYKNDMGLEEQKPHDFTDTSALKYKIAKQSKELSKDEKARKQYEKEMALGKEKAIKTQKTTETEKQLISEKKRIRTKSDREDENKKGGSAQDDKSDKPEVKEKGQKERRHDLAVTSALKDQVSKQAKELLQDEKTSKQYEKDMALGEKKAREAQKTIEDNKNQLTTEKRRIQAVPDGEDGHKKDRKDQHDKSEKLEAKDKGREQKEHELAATSVLKDQVTKQAKEKLEADKMRKQQELDIALGEKKAKDAEKAIADTQKQLTTEKKQKLPEIKLSAEDDDKGKKEKNENVDKPPIEEKGKGDVHGEMIAILKDQMAKQKQLELEQEKLRKEQQKERELADKKLQELETQKKEMASAIKPFILLPEVASDDEDVVEIISMAEEVTDIIKGEKIYNIKTIKRAEGQPELPKHYSEQTAVQQNQFHETSPGELDTEVKPSINSPRKSKTLDPEAAKGVIRYTLSDRTFIDKGWTMLPTEKVVRKMNVYRMRPAKPEFDWFEHNKYKREMTYESGEKLAEFDDNGRGRWYYRSGELALDYYDAEETNAGQRFVIYSTRQPDGSGRCHPRTVLATFDYAGNGIVFDHTGKIRLKYNQTEGVVLDRTIGPVSHWKWHTLNDPPVLQQVMIDTQMPYKDPTILKMGDKNADKKRPDNEEMIAIEFDNFLKEKRQKLTQSFKPFQIKMKAMKINDNFSLRVLDQASVYLLFRDGTANLKINLGMVLDHKEIVDTDTAEIGEVSNGLDKLPACTDSIAGLQKAVAQAQAAERSRVRHEQRLKRPSEVASADALRAGCSRPPRTPVVHASLTSCDKMTPKRFKPTCSELYYSTHLC